MAHSTRKTLFQNYVKAISENYNYFYNGGKSKEPLDNQNIKAAQIAESLRQADDAFFKSLQGDNSKKRIREYTEILVRRALFHNKSTDTITLDSVIDHLNQPHKAIFTGLQLSVGIPLTLTGFGIGITFAILCATGLLPVVTLIIAVEVVAFTLLYLALFVGEQLAYPKYVKEEQDKLTTWQDDDIEAQLNQETLAPNSPTNQGQHAPLFLPVGPRSESFNHEFGYGS